MYYTIKHFFLAQKSTIMHRLRTGKKLKNPLPVIQLSITKRRGAQQDVL